MPAIEVQRVFFYYAEPIMVSGITPAYNLVLVVQAFGITDMVEFSMLKVM